MSEQNKIDEIKAALSAASTQYEWETDGSFIAWKDGHPLRGTYRQIALTHSPTPEVFTNENHENDAAFLAKAPEYITYLLQEITTLKTNLEYWEPMANRLADSVEKLQGEVEFWKQAADNQKDNNMKLISVIHEKDEKMREAINIWETATPEDDFDDIMHAVIDELKDSLAL